MFSIIFKKTNQIKSGPVGVRRAKLFFSSTLSARKRTDSHERSKVLNDYFKARKVPCAEKLFEEMPDKNVVIWSMMVHGYSKNGFSRKIS